MTTIAYKNGILAADSRLLREDYIISENFPKVHSFVNASSLFGMLGNFSGYYASCGDVASGHKVFNSIFEKEALQPLDNTSFGALILFKDDCNEKFLYCLDYNMVPFEFDLKEYISIGSGCMFAIAALDCDKSAVDSIVIAAKRDMYSNNLVSFGDINSDVIEVQRNW